MDEVYRLSIGAMDASRRELQHGCCGDFQLLLVAEIWNMASYWRSVMALACLPQHLEAVIDAVS